LGWNDGRGNWIASTMGEEKLPQRWRSDWTIIAIGLFKLIKSVTLCAVGVALVHWRHADLGQVASRWVSKLWLSRAYFQEAIARLSFASERTVHHFMIASFVYSVLLLVEGVGLCLRKRWAEYLTVLITGSLLPFEFYELYRRVTRTGMAITVVNIAILVYLVMRLIQERRTK
jgi:uncharacterized membrane protein (DUF2068 family)